MLTLRRNILPPTAAVDIKCTATGIAFLFSEYELVRSFKWVSYFNQWYVVDYDMKYVELNPILISE